MKSKKALIETVEKNLLSLHRRYLELERIDYERSQGRSLSPFEFLQLLTQNQEFQWLRPLSQLLAEIDSIESPSEAYKRILDVLSQQKVHERREYHDKHDQQFAKLNQALSESMPFLLK